MSRRKLDIMEKKFDKLIEDIPTVEIDKNGRVSNWNQLSNFTKEDTLECGIYDDVDFSKSKLKYPALHKWDAHQHKLPPFW